MLEEKAKGDTPCGKRNVPTAKFFNEMQIQILYYSKV